MNFLESKRKYLKEWIERHRKAKEIIPLVQKELEMTEWELEALQNIPSGVNKKPFDDLETKFETDYNYTVKTFPMIPEYDRSAVQTALSVATDSTSSVYLNVVQVGSWAVADAESYSKKYRESYQQMQIAHNRPEEVNQLLQKINSVTLKERYEKASKGYYAVKSGTEDWTAVASEMRNFVMGLKGELFEKARKQPRENMTWDVMAERLSKGGKDSVEHQELKDQMKTYDELIDILSPALKDRKNNSSDVEIIWSRILDHIYVVIGLIKI